MNEQMTPKEIISEAMDLGKTRMLLEIHERILYRCENPQAILAELFREHRLTVPAGMEVAQ